MIGPLICAARAGDTSNTHTGVSFAGQVLDRETKKAVRGAALLVERALPGIDPTSWPAWAGKTTHVTDSQGRFRVSFPPEQLSEERLAVTVSITHPEYIGRRTPGTVPLVNVLIAKKSGDATLFDKLELERGEEYTGEVVSPAGDPVAGAAVELSRWGEDTNPSPYFSDLTTTATGAEGRFRLRLPKAQQLAVVITTPAYAGFRHFWGADDPSESPDQLVPLDLGQLKLSSGVRLLGRLLNLQGQPIARQTITARACLLNCVRTTITNADGRFGFDPLRPGNYVVFGAGQRAQEGADTSEPPVSGPGAIFKPVKVYLRDGVVPAPLLLREMPTVVVEVQFVDSHGRPTRGCVTALWGSLPPEPGQLADQGPDFGNNGLSALFNGTEPEDKSAPLSWTEQLVPDAQGRVVFRVPKGILNAQLQTQAPDDTLAIKVRAGADKPLELAWNATLGPLNSDVRGVQFVVYKSPRVLVRVQTADGARPFLGSSVAALLPIDGTELGANFVEQADERHRSQYLLPDHEYLLAASSFGFIPNRVERIKLPEGAAAEITLVVRPQPLQPRVGDIAPPFFVKTRDGQAISLHDLRGKYVLLHWWHPQYDNCAPEVAHLKAVSARFGSSGRLVILGFCPLIDPTAAVAFIKEKALTWSQVICRDGTWDATMQDYEANIPTAILVGPDGRLLARDLQGKAIEEAVAKALRVDKAK
jgi:peroxiredoxin